MRPPFFVDARGDLMIYASAEELVRRTTPEAVRSGAYPIVYDADGRLLRLTVKVREWKTLGLVPRRQETVVLEPTEQIPTHEVALRALLLRFVSAPAAPAANAHPLAGLVRT